MAAASVRLRAPAVIALAVAAGLVRVDLLPEYSANPYDSYLSIEGVVVREVERRIDHQRITVETASLDGLLLVQANRYPTVTAGDRLAISCTLRQPEPFDGFRYDRWLARFGIGSTCYYPGLEVVGHVDTLASRLLTGKRWLVSRLQFAVPPPEVGLLQGALFGQKWAVEESTIAAFRNSGTAHLLVISGLHISLIVSGLFALTKALRLSRGRSLLLVSAALALYVFGTGLQPSALRASLLTGSALAALQLGRATTSLRLLLFIATGMLLVNPLLIYDVGFQLSVSATAGIVLLSQPITRCLTVLPSWGGLRSLTGVSLAAILATSPIIAKTFGTISPVAFLANLLLVPLMPLVMVLALIVLVATAIFPSLGQLLALPLTELLHFMIFLADWLASLPGANIRL